MEYLAIVGIPALVAWGVSVAIRCVTVRAERALIALLGVLVVLLNAAIVIGGLFLQVAIVAVCVVVVATEILLAANIIVSESGYHVLFARLPLDVRILTNGGREVYHTDVSRKLDNTTLWRLARQCPSNEHAPVTIVRDEAHPGMVFKMYQLRAGVALVTEDSREYDRLRAQLEEKRDNLVAQNEILANHQDVLKALRRQQRERELYERVEKDLAESAAQIHEILDQAPSSGGSGVGGKGVSLEQLTKVKALVAYSKRKGMLALAGAESDVISVEQLQAIAWESMADLGSIGVECAVLVATDIPVPAAVVNETYDSFYDCIISVLPRANPVVMVCLEGGGSAPFVMSVSMECALGLDSESAVELIPETVSPVESWSPVLGAVAHDVDLSLQRRGVDYKIHVEDGTVRVVVRASSTHSQTMAEGDSA